LNFNKKALHLGSRKGFNQAHEFSNKTKEGIMKNPGERRKIPAKTVERKGKGRGGAALTLAVDKNPEEEK